MFCNVFFFKKNVAGICVSVQVRDHLPRRSAFEENRLLLLHGQLGNRSKHPAISRTFENVRRQRAWIHETVSMEGNEALP